MYEVSLLTQGIIQMGWTVIDAIFTLQEGVGDSPGSYAYDGNRRKKWHLQHSDYGETWTTGDVIGCCIDMDLGAISFYRNGHDMGVAFSVLA